MIATLSFRRMIDPSFAGPRAYPFRIGVCYTRFGGVIEEQMADWTDQVAIVTGSSRGIGRAIARALGARSARSASTSNITMLPFRSGSYKKEKPERFYRPTQALSLIVC